MRKSIDRGKRIPLYAQFAARIKQSIRDGRYSSGEFLPGERELSEKFGVNRDTVRRAVVDLVREGLIERVPSVGHRVLGDRQKPVAVSHAIGCIMLRNVGGNGMSQYYSDIFCGIEGESSDRGYQLVLSTAKELDLWGEDGHVRNVSGLVQKGFAGAIFVGGLPEELPLAYHAGGIPVIHIDRPSLNRSIGSVMPDNLTGAYEVAQYLVKLGHRRISFFGVDSDPVAEARLAGLERALREAGLSFNTRDFINGGYEVKPAHDAMKNYLATPRKNLPTAIFAINDESAVGVLKALNEHGLRVPEDVSLTGFDDVELASHSQPPLTTVRIPRLEMGRTGARNLIAQIESRSAIPASTVLPTEVVIRKSCAVPRAT